jgi:hypothetical protein
MGLLSFNSIGMFYGAKVIIVIFVLWLKKIFFSCYLFTTLGTYAQGLKILITEKKHGKRIEHRVFDSNKDPVIYRQFMTFIEHQLTLETNIRFPLIWNKTFAIFGNEELRDMETELSGE